ncbi:MULTISPECIES: zinc-dependent alcohol dehydrogenase family protein [Mammaliicoccus]|jgi:alcohol dehydrogenase|uniref:Zinc-dependent alcohol dehydrogenase family protein n=1 Tax=Mammaliicoccus sciuri TaxID=1296 RepID=A0AAW5LPV9_MAMSC|nr:MULTISPECIES: zinc-dependent alcohol dehydrogenase family protein [Mammaliicoccus]MBG9211037.1 alcohol dehydrogenase catalytic domain-containing protein [Mammaliicoccus sciuri]MCD5139728.1 zinc-dependent alcohol dehydrogenase family protein [Mammaliicoccus sciuri]MCD8882905.1 zinc-dependent alcohol dehydrogenase family protein [Mammaliicoccus sciuri]MCI8456334.1 alcohol dehydrogenase catalytic domain-containing protein [Mammaliicoccus sciuri]MCJ0936118.1 zinc-dependent alcohol dehydrogenase
MKTRAAVLHEMGLPSPYSESKPLKIETLELNKPNQNEVLIKIGAAGLCHSDLSVINGSRPRPTPMALGHEAAGEIIEIGDNVTNFEVGDHVVCTFIPNCGHCLPCSEGRPALCENGAASNEQGELLDGGIRLHNDEDNMHHHLGVSGFADYAVVSQHSIVKVDKDIPFEKVAIFGCAVITGIGAVINTAQVKPGSSVAVVGLGGIGLNAILGAKLAGAGEIIALDINPGKFELAKKLGATATFNSGDDDVVEQVKEYVKGGVEYAFETAGVVPAMEVAYKITKRGGSTVTTGLPDPKHEFSFPQVTLAAEERTIKGSYVGSCVPMRDIPRFIALYKQGRLDIDSLLTDTLPLDEINEGFDRLAKGDAARLVVKINNG